MGSKLYTRGERIFKWVSLVLLLVICVATQLLAPKVQHGQLPVHVEPAQTDWSLLFDLPGHYGGGYRG